MANLVKPSKNIKKMNSGLFLAKCFLLSHYAACFTTYSLFQYEMSLKGEHISTKE